MSTISVPEHLWETLLPLAKIEVEPPELLDLLQEHIKPGVEDTSTEIPYDLIVGISKWSQSEGGIKKLEGDGLDPKSYSLIPLLAGTTFAPSSKPPPPPEPPKDTSSDDRRAITALINGLFSVVGVGFAAWWASGNVYWRNETRVLLALAASIVVAIAEGVLYLIWSSHLEKRKQHRKLLASKPKPRAKVQKLKSEESEQQEDLNTEQRDDVQSNVLHRRGYEYKNDEGSTDS